MKSIVLLIGLVSLFGCATSPLLFDSAVQQEIASLTASQQPLSHAIPGVPFINQEVGHCGPATLAMVMSWHGSKVDVQDLAEQVYTPGMQGSLQQDLISASRRHKFLAIPIKGFPSLLKEVAAGHPVIVFENLGLSWYSQWHYAVVHGFDLATKTLTLHSGPEANQVISMRRFEKDWSLADYWGLVVLPPGQLSASASELDHLKAAAAIEQLGHLNEAEKAYQSIMNRWPDSFASHMGLGNISYAKENYSAAITYLEQATRLEPQSASAWHNLAIAAGTKNETVKAKAATENAIKHATTSEKEAYRKSLKEWLKR